MKPRDSLGSLISGVCCQIWLMLRWLMGSDPTMAPKTTSRPSSSCSLDNEEFWLFRCSSLSELLENELASLKNF